MENDTSCKYLSKGNRTGVAILISNILQSKQNHQRQRWLLYNDTRVNPQRRQSSPKCVQPDNRPVKCVKPKEGAPERKNRQTHNCSWRLQHPF